MLELADTYSGYIFHGTPGILPWFRLQEPAARENLATSEANFGPVILDKTDEMMIVRRHLGALVGDEARRDKPLSRILAETRLGVFHKFHLAEL